MNVEIKKKELLTPTIIQVLQNCPEMMEKTHLTSTGDTGRLNAQQTERSERED